MDITIHIPDNCERYAVDIKRFVDAMLWKLRKNAHKGRWEDLPIGEAYQLMCGEAEELRAEIERPSNAFDIVFEAADVANYALMIASMAVEKSSTFKQVDALTRTEVGTWLLDHGYAAYAEHVTKVAEEHGSDDGIPF